MSKYAKGSALSYEGVLEAIESNLKYIDQWKASNHLERASKSLIEAVTLIELLEVHNCGSIGGFDEGQSRGGYNSIADRFEWLKSKFQKEKESIEATKTQKIYKIIVKEFLEGEV